MIYVFLFSTISVISATENMAGIEKVSLETMFSRGFMVALQLEVLFLRRFSML